MTKKILITVGYRKRELEYLTLLATFLRKAKFDVKIRYFNFELYHEIFTWQPDFVTLGQVNQNENIDFAKFATKSGSQVVVINQEGVYDVTDKYLYLFFGDKCNSYVDLKFVWGKQHLTDVLRLTDIEASKIFAFGTPKFDVYHPQLKTFYQLQSPYQSKLDKQKKTICLATSFHEADTQWDAVKNNVSYQTFGEQEFSKRANYYAQVREKFIDLANKLINLNQYNLIFRIHPLEQAEYYQKRLENLDRIIFDNSASPVKLFSVTDLLIHRTSTLASEAWLNNVPTLSFDPIQNRDKLMLDLTKFNLITHSVSEMISKIDEILNKPAKALNNNRQRNAYLKKWYGINPNQRNFASAKITEQINRTSIKPKRVIWHLNVLIYYVLFCLKVISQKQEIYEVIGILKGKKYVQILKQNIIYDNETNNLIAEYRRFLFK